MLAFSGALRLEETHNLCWNAFTIDHQKKEILFEVKKSKNGLLCKFVVTNKGFYDLFLRYKKLELIYSSSELIAKNTNSEFSPWFYPSFNHSTQKFNENQREKETGLINK